MVFGPGARYRAAEDIDLLDRVVQLGATIVYQPNAVVFHEMKTSRERLARRYPYAYGLGAMVAQRGQRDSLRLVASYGRMQALALARGIRALSAREVAEPVLAMTGFSVGAFRAVIDSGKGGSRTVRRGPPRS